MAAHQAVPVRVHHQLDEAPSAPVLGHVPPREQHGQLDLFHGEALGLGALHALAHAGHLRVGVDDGGDHVVAHLVPDAQHVVDGHLGLPVGGMGQQGLAVAVTDGVHPGHVGTQVPVRDHGGAVGLDAQFLQAQPGGIGTAPGADQDRAALELLTLALLLINHGIAGDLQDLAVQLEGHVPLLIVVHQHLADLRVRVPGQLGQHLDDGDLHPRHGEVIGQLQPHHAAANDGHLLGQLLQVQGLAAGEGEALLHGLLQPGDGGHRRLRAAGDDQPRPGVALAPRVHLEASLDAARDDGLLPDHGDLVGLHGGLYAGDQLLDHLPLPLEDGGVVQDHVFGGDAEGGALRCVAIELDRVEQGLGGDAPLVEAGAAHVPGLEEAHGHAALGGPLGTQIAARASADD